MHASLICEGNCNPRVGQLDRRVSALRHEIGGAGPLPDLQLLNDLNALHHTPHTETTEDRFTCDVCGHGRQYGAHGHSRWAGN